MRENGHGAAKSVSQSLWSFADYPADKFYALDGKKTRSTHPIQTLCFDYIFI
jgi:hypothetical protein